MTRWILVAAVAFGMAGVATLPACAAESTTAKAADKAAEVEVKIKLEDCPKAVQDTIKKEMGAGVLKEVEKETEDGKTTYSADVTIDGKAYEVKVGEDGTLLKKKLDTGKDEGEKGEHKGEHEDKD